MIAKKKYRYIYSCLRGNNFYNKKNTLIKRDTVYLENSINLLKIFLSGIIDLKYLLKKIKIDKKL